MELCVGLLTADEEINPLIRSEPSEAYHSPQTHQLTAEPSGTGLGNSDSNHSRYIEKKSMINIRMV